MSRNRAAILKSMLDGGANKALSAAQTTSLADAMNTATKAFSEKQLDSMEAAGVRIWPFAKGQPPEYLVGKDDQLKGPASYNPQVRTIKISPASLERGAGALTDYLRHELAHAWDNVRTGKLQTSLRKLKGDALAAELELRAQQSEPFESESKKKLPPDKTYSMGEMLDRYKKLVKGLGDKTRTFANPGTADQHNARDVKEFYAEGYSVFHGNQQTSQGRMLWLAPEFFKFLDHEANGNGLPRPGKDGLKQVLDANDKGWRATWDDHKS